MLTKKQKNTRRIRHDQARKKAASIRKAIARDIDEVKVRLGMESDAQLRYRSKWGDGR
jgi:hypothetical protein